jgi:hypothetical protein
MESRADSEGFHKSPSPSRDERPSLGRLYFAAHPRLGEPPLCRLDPRAQAPVELSLGLKTKSAPANWLPDAPSSRNDPVNSDPYRRKSPYPTTIKRQ